MNEDLAAALAAFLVALAALLRDELHRRRSDRARAELHAQVIDVQRKVGADRRASDEATVRSAARTTTQRGDRPLA